MHPGWLVAWTVGLALGGDPAGALPLADPAAAPASSPPPARGLGTITGRVPGTTAMIGGVRLVRHHARIVVRDGFARTEIEEEVANDTARVLEGRYAFAVPAGAAVTRLALWVGHDLVEGELVERRRARSIFRGIVEDTVRPRDPALLEHLRGGELSMTIFPLPARGTRTVVLAWDEVLAPVEGRLRLVHALTPGPGRAARVDDLAVTVRVVGAAASEVSLPGWSADVERDDDGATLRIAARDRAPDRDVIVDLGPASTGPTLVLSAPEPPTGAPDAPPVAYFAARLTVPAPHGGAPERPLGDRVVVLDTSASQTAETIAAQAELARAAARALRPEERLAVLACESACTSFPEEGLVLPDHDALRALDGFLGGLVARGASDLAGAIAAGTTRLANGGQVVVAHDGHASAGELATDAMAARLAGPIEVAGADVRLVGLGRTVDELALARLAAGIGASFEPWGPPADDEGAAGARARALTAGLDRAAVEDATLELPAGLHDVVPSVLPRVRVGDPVTVMGTVGPGFDGGELRLVGAVRGEPVTVAAPLVARAERPNPLLPKLWAHRAIAELDAGGDAARAEVVALSRAHHVLSPHTSLLVLESERMFADFGVERTTLRPEDQSDHAFGALGAGAPLADPGAAGSPGGGRTRRSPQLRLGSTTVSGRLPPETVQRTVRLQMGRFRACYERGLARDPLLAGRVATRFVIGWTGQVVSTADVGSDLPDRDVVACVVRHFQALEFPPPEGGTVVVVYPIVFTSDGTRPKAPPALWPEPTVRPLPPRPQVKWTPPPPRPSPWVVQVTHLPGDEAWRVGRDAELARLAAAVAAEPASRSRRERQVRALLLAGRWEAARDAAARLLELDPDLPLAHELAAVAAAAEDDGDGAVAAVDGVAESSPRDVDAHRRAARAFAAAGDGRRACAHLRTLAGLATGGASPADRHTADRCWEDLLSGAAPRVDAEREGDAAGGAFTATVRCAAGVSRCPRIAVVTPTGRVVSRSAPFGAEPVVGGVALAAAGEGTWRTVLLGGDADAHGTVRVRVHGSVREVPFTGASRTVLTTRIEQRRRPTPRW